jgi:hypothetical protein
MNYRNNVPRKPTGGALLMARKWWTLTAVLAGMFMLTAASRPPPRP